MKLEVGSAEDSFVATNDNPQPTLNVISEHADDIEDWAKSVIDKGYVGQILTNDSICKGWNAGKRGAQRHEVDFGSSTYKSFAVDYPTVFDDSIVRIVTKVDKRFDKRGEPFGIVTIEDFEGAGDIAIFGEEWGRWSGMLQEGYSVFVKARYAKRFPTSRMFTLTISNVEFLQSAKDKRIERFTINVPSDKIDDTVANDIETMIQDRKGPTELYFNVTDETTNTHILLRAARQRIEVSKDLVQYIEDNKNMSYNIN